MTESLAGKTIAFLATDGFEQVELTQPWEELKRAGATVHLISLDTGSIQGMNHSEKADTFSVDHAVAEVKAAQYDALVLPGGVANPDTLRVDEKAVGFVRAFFDEGKPVAAICHGPWILIDADIISGRRVTSWPSLRKDLENAGAAWVDEEVVNDGGLITSRKPDDLDAFCEEVIKAFA